MARTIHVISPVAGFGNALDLDLVCSILQEGGFDVTSYPVRKREKTARLSQVARRIFSGRGRFDVNLFLAPIFPEWLPMARKNILVPNVEGFPGHLHKWLPRIDLVLAKTRLTERIFRELGCPTEFTSFTSPDHLDEKIPRDYTKFYHSCSSPYKGTRRLLDVWRKHPEWPELVTVLNPTITKDFEGPNIHAILKRLPGEEIIRLQNSIGFHICSSEAEGFGHFIMEAMSCGAVTLTTNGPPMNELVQPSRGVLLDCLDEAPKLGLSNRYLFKPESLEEQVERVTKWDLATLQQIGTAARTFFLENDRAFRARLVELMRSI
jgi:glycosyltransferase involved in cell wall biosynthesis